MNPVPEIRSLYHQSTHTWSHVAWEPDSLRALIVDPVLDYDASSGRTGTDFLESLVGLVEAESLKVEWILETHAHADHLTSGARLKDRLGCQLAIGAGIRAVQSHFCNVFNLGDGFTADGSQFDRLFEDGDRFSLGGMEVRVMHTPGHTDDSVTYVLGDVAFIGDTLFTPEYGTARCDFPGGDARRLFRSIQQIFALGNATRLFLCHDYPPEGRPPRPMVSVAEQRAANVHVRDGTSEDEFVEMRQRRDRSLAMPELILPSIQVNIRAGRFPDPEDNGVTYLKIPVDRL
jgi:glyoxylase-like metal-dependent hydrolase (beta-lactamase superfamily II)